MYNNIKNNNNNDDDDNNKYNNDFIQMSSLLGGQRPYNLGIHLY